MSDESERNNVVIKELQKDIFRLFANLKRASMEIGEQKKVVISIPASRISLNPGVDKIPNAFLVSEHVLLAYTFVIDYLLDLTLTKDGFRPGMVLPLLFKSVEHMPEGDEAKFFALTAWLLGRRTVEHLAEFGIELDYLSKMTFNRGRVAFDQIVSILRRVEDISIKEESNRPPIELPSGFVEVNVGEESVERALEIENPDYIRRAAWLLHLPAASRTEAVYFILKNWKLFAEKQSDGTFKFNRLAYALFYSGVAESAKIGLRSMGRRMGVLQLPPVHALIPVIEAMMKSAERPT